MHALNVATSDEKLVHILFGSATVLEAWLSVFRSLIECTKLYC